MDQDVAGPFLHSLLYALICIRWKRKENQLYVVEQIREQTLLQNYYYYYNFCISQTVIGNSEIFFESFKKI